MRSTVSMFKAWCALMLGLLLAGSALAQQDNGQYQILQARYGSAQQNVDVTERLKELARSDQRFRMGNETFGIDPAPGVPKTLRIFTRGPGGAQRTFEYREGSVVDGSLFTAWSGGDWGQGGWNGDWNGGHGGGDEGQYQILQARYGTADRNVDVTQRLREIARQDQTFRMGNETFGVDPAPGVLKTLRIFTRGPRGMERMFEYREGSIIDGAMFTGWHRGNWGRGGWRGGWGNGEAAAYSGVSIAAATYGVPGSQIDVTSQLNSMVREGRLDIMANNATFGRDPAPRRRKSLWVTYAVDGRTQPQIRVDENQRLTLP